jgi:peroxiredoxin
MTTTPVPQQPMTAETQAAGRQWQDRWASGPRRTRWTSLPVQAGDRAPSLDLVDARLDRAVPLASGWADGPALLLFWRHFGCSCGRDRAARLIDELPAYRAAGATVTLIGQGEPERTLVYAAANDIPAEVRLLCDPEERAYEAYGLLEGSPVEVLFDAPDEYLRCDIAAGRSLFDAREAEGRPMVDNPWLLPGEFVVAQDGSLVTTYRFAFCEHWIDPRVNVAAIRSATGEVRAIFPG